MLKAEYSRKINKSSFVLKPEKDCGDEKDSIEMFQFNKIPYFLSMQKQTTDTELKFCYDITSKRSLEQLLEYKSLDYLLFQKIITSFDQACIETENYMLTENDILLKPEFVFIESDTEQMVYCYFPGNQHDICKQFKEFMEYLLRILNHKDEQAVRLAYGIYQRVIEEKASLHNVLGRTEQILSESSNVNIYMMGDEQTHEDARMVKKQLHENDSMQAEQLHVNQSMPDTELFYSKQNIRDVKMLHEKRNLEVNMQLCINQNGNEAQKYDKQKGQVWEEPYAEKENNHINKIWKEEEAGGLGKVKQLEEIREQQEQDMLDAEALRTKGKCKKSNKDKRQKDIPQIDLQIKKKEKLRKRAAEKLKKMLIKKIYTDRDKYAEETVFEADTEEELEIRNPTVCLMPETDSIQNKFVYQGSDRTRDFQCMGQKMILGSDRDESDICIPIPMISRVHARIEVNAQGTFLEDMNSTNGTHVNGELLQYHERRLLQKGDIISLAGESYSFH